MKIDSKDINVIKLSGTDIAVNTTAYADNDLVGALVTKAGAVGKGAGVLVISVTVRDLTNQKAALSLVIFDGTPGNGTYTNNSAFDLHDSDAPQVVGHIPIAAADYISFADNAVATVNDNIVLAFIAERGGTLSFALVSNAATPTYAANELSVDIGISTF